MNLEFNISVHVLSFLTKHNDEHFSSQELAELTCLNPVQLRRVTTILTNHGFITTLRGQRGGYRANDTTPTIKLSTLYQMFVVEKTKSQRIFTGSEHSHCAISRNIAHTMSHYKERELALTLDFYSQLTINDVIQDIIKEDTTHVTL
ncbi:Rrf2 family transcriptional regulator [Staphylococcus devriesei]|uniref:Rrf2 family transcriptional regulator n=1 Tax=Staphylococcus devriesei TaxID=586733 RepID=A0A2K4DQL8_9STAP|nr:redox-sensitive transcriptional regulator HypR [Staphylococcus devriesei]MCE5090666.1 Rrf2 family transcriptional regulator [Staphylococcus devriesei]MCE5096794.1 Rrf2 family transcriptional regulator [Staphylococcus devriesei]PNZ89111.1 transcriptional regulator [Staphylococcus devriesei]PTE73302.1 Rrf2 family transcriptional regulator [Staphylococcus devriesei]PTF05189.1 Rrf2 family transcriptional regulator [Staphylococcus devriesei]